MLRLYDRLLQQLARVPLAEQSMGIQLLGQFEDARLISNLKLNPEIQFIYGIYQKDFLTRRLSACGAKSGLSCGKSGFRLGLGFGFVSNARVLS